MAMNYRTVADRPSLERAVQDIQAESRIALDCEAAGFHRYHDRLCLVQMSTASETYLFDPFAVELGPALRPILENPELEVVMHGADYDLRLLSRDLGIRVRGLFDTQLAASLVGASAIGLAALLSEYLGIELSKKHQRADWAQRPLPEELLDYAADDTRHLLSLRDALAERLQALGREEWAREEFRALEHSVETAEEEQEASDPLLRIKKAKYLTPREAAGLRAALAWRDAIAREKDRAPFRIVGDATLLEVVRERPTDSRALAAVRGFSPSLARRHGRALLEALREIDALPDGDLPALPRPQRNGPGRLNPEQEELADRIRQVRAARAAELGLEKGVLLSNSQIAEIVRRTPRSLEELKRIRSVRNWQAEQVGREILKLLE